MFSRATLLGALFAALTWTAASAAPGVATGSVNLRTGPGTVYAKITVIPAGAAVEVLECPSWCQVSYAGHEGWASADYIRSTGYTVREREVYVEHRIYEPAYVYADRPPLPPRHLWRHGRPWWHDRYEAWYDGHGYWYGDRWHSRPRVSVTVDLRNDHYDRPRCWLPERCW